MTILKEVIVIYDIKLKDGRYFSNIDVIDIVTGEMTNIESILDNADYKMQIYHINDVDSEELLAEIISDDIEYICKCYRYIRKD